MKRLALVAFACTGPRAAPPPPPPPSPPAPDATTIVIALDATPAPDADLGVVGHWAIKADHVHRGNHNGQNVVWSWDATLVLELSADGTVTACRAGERRDHTYKDDGDTESGYNEQYGYRGTLTGDRLTLTRDESVCPTIAEAWPRAVDRPKSLELTCERTTLAEVDAPILQCKDEASSFWFDELSLTGFGESDWFYLAPGKGLLVKSKGKPPQGYFGGPKHEHTIEVVP